MIRTISVVIPSRLDGGHLTQAVESVNSQSHLDQLEVQIIVGVDHGKAEGIELEFPGPAKVEFAESSGHSQAAALNAAIAKARGEYIAFLEDDDRWHPRFLTHGLAVLDAYDFASSTQLEVDELGMPQGINAYPTPSGWIMRRETFAKVGLFDESYYWHIDTEWLGRLGETVRSRAHLVESTVDLPTYSREQLAATPSGRGPDFCWGLEHILMHGQPNVELVHSLEPVPLVTRLVHNASKMQQIARDDKLRAESVSEYARMTQRFGRIPW